MSAATGNTSSRTPPYEILLQETLRVLLSPYSLLTPPQIVFGWGRRVEVGRLAATLGSRAFLISGSRTLTAHGVIGQIAASLTEAGLAVVAETAPDHEPEVADVDRLTAAMGAHHIRSGDCVVAVGGGSTLDLAKAAAAMATNAPTSEPPCSVVDYLEGVGKGYQLTAAPLPMLALPTTAGTGSEATKNAVISCYDPLFKKSLRSDRMVPRIVLVDPELTVSVPRTTTAYTGMDAITQLLESYISRRAAPIPQALCVQGLELALPAIVTACSDGANRAAREALSHAALLSGIALANSGLGLAHGVAAALGVHARVPHGLACAVMLVPALRFNQVCRRSALAELARVVLRSAAATEETAATILIEHIEKLCRAVDIPTRLRDLGVRQEQIPDLVTGSQGNSLSGNPRDVSLDELRELLESLW